MITNILLIDDNDSQLPKLLFERAYEVFGNDVNLVSASTITKGLEEIEQTTFDLILIDLSFPGFGPEGVIDFIETQYAGLPPLVVLTGSLDPKLRRRCINAGAKQYVSKDDMVRSPNFFFSTIYNEFLKAKREKAACEQQVQIQEELLKEISPELQP